ncbi:MAG: SMP-30/gluconolactonase/LRE family protein [Gammaproteobacteria bacterium]|nr:MAG: SMP-30/gluconolactonase/LRE family protein [Gammaproteobacteria bacterium]
MNSIKSFTLNLEDLKFVHQGLARPESILAEKDGTLWTDDSRGSLTRINADGKMTTVGTIGGEPNGFALAADGHFYIPNIGDGNVYKMDKDGNHEIFLSEIDGKPLGAPNYVFIDSKDRLWISISSRELPWFKTINTPTPDGYIILVDDNGPRIIADGIYFPNEIRMNEDETFLYVAETMKARMIRYPVNQDGSLGEMEVFGPENLGEGGYIDGFTFDADGNVWVTTIIRNGIGLITPDGDYHVVFEDVNQVALDAAIKAMENGVMSPELMFACVGSTVQFPVSITFGGEDLKTVYLGSLAMPHMVTFQSPIAGLKMRHWDD